MLQHNLNVLVWQCMPYAVLFTCASRSLMHNCQRSEGRKMAKSSTTSVDTSAETGAMTANNLQLNWLATNFFHQFLSTASMNCCTSNIHPLLSADLTASSHLLTGILHHKIAWNTININWAWSADKYSLTVSMQSSSVLMLCSVRTHCWAYLCENQHHVSNGSCGDKIKSCFIHSPLKNHRAALPTRPG